MSMIEQSNQTEQTIPTGTWQADTVHSRVAFEVPYAVATFTGEVPTFEASLEDGTLRGVAQIRSLQVKEENLEAHLLSPEFFDAERHPEVSSPRTRSAATATRCRSTARSRSRASPARRR